MKTLQFVKQENEQLDKDLKKGEITERDLLRRRSFLKPIILLLETNPMEAHLKRQLKEVSDKLEVIDNGFSTWQSNTPNKPTGNSESEDRAKQKSVYNRIMDRASVSLQVKTLKYILF